MYNHKITDLIGGIQYVTLGDEEAKRRGSAKSILERKAPPTFEVAIAIHVLQRKRDHCNDQAEATTVGRTGSWFRKTND